MRAALAALLMVLAAAGALAADAPPAASPAKKPELLAFGTVAPDIAGPVLNGAAGTRLAQYRGRVVAVDFWATWCGPCQESVPELNRVRNELRQEGWADQFEVVSVNVDNDVDRARRFLAGHPVDYPVIGDPIGIAMQRYGPWKLPATFLLEPDGKIHMIWLGYANYFAADIKKTALEVLQKKPTTAP